MRSLASLNQKQIANLLIYVRKQFIFIAANIFTTY